MSTVVMVVAAISPEQCAEGSVSSPNTTGIAHRQENTNAAAAALIIILLQRASNITPPRQYVCIK